MLAPGNNARLGSLQSPKVYLDVGMVFLLLVVATLPCR